MRKFKDGETITVEPWRTRGFPVVKDLVVDRGAFDKILQAGGFISVNAGNAPDANAIPVSYTHLDVYKRQGSGANEKEEVDLLSYKRNHFVEYLNGALYKRVVSASD